MKLLLKTALFGWALLFALPIASANDEKDLIAAAVVAFKDVSYKQSGSDEIKASDKDQLEINIKSIIDRYTDNYGDLDEKSRHFEREVDNSDSSSELYDHFGECDVCRGIVNRLVRKTSLSRIPKAPNYQQPANFCRTNLGACQMGIAVPVGTSCYCPSAYGVVWGVATY